MTHIDHRIVEDGNQKFGLTDMADIGKYVAQIVADPRTVNKHVFAYTEVLSMNQIWDTMAAASGETPEKDYVSWLLEPLPADGPSIYNEPTTNSCNIR